MEESGGLGPHTRRCSLFSKQDRRPGRFTFRRGWRITRRPRCCARRFPTGPWNLPRSPSRALGIRFAVSPTFQDSRTNQIAPCLSYPGRAMPGGRRRRRNRIAHPKVSVVFKATRWTTITPSAGRGRIERPWSVLETNLIPDRCPVLRPCTNRTPPIIPYVYGLSMTYPGQMSGASANGPPPGGMSGVMESNHLQPLRGR